MEGLLIVIGSLATLWWLHLWLFPGPMRIAKRVLRWLGRKAADIGWRVPKRHLGVGKTLWLWTVIGAVLVTFGTFMQPGSATRPGGRLQDLLVMWSLVFAGWLLLRWWARRRFRPRDLPRRRR